MSMMMTQDEIKNVIPHREPMLLIDQVKEIETGKQIVAEFYVSRDMELFKGHFPGAPVLPGVYAVECMAQASDILLLSLDRYKGKIPYFIGIDKVSFKCKIGPGDTIEIRSNIINERLEKSIVTCRAVITNNGEEAAVGEVTLAMR